jgi:hypothetical protein
MLLRIVTAIGIGLGSVTLAVGAPPVPSLPPVVVTAQRRGPHPEIEAAIASLQQTKSDLEKASHDFGGHRVNAIANVDNALKELRICLTYP